ncbi:flagellar hook assembly protein FlgD [Bacillus sp. FJAT-42315]|uniref:flagellar hook assembly protein FlgD n=1 Tax=Bacillus sp. FJAT-42315 TaxID=2014077 RepID=UPI000BA8EFB3|nr:flagellar hook assembly protein FlgD [Bacillus sp. FJAT-42315]PAQ15886.1 flagellar hook assembly protein FlgD [Bacillaceae bacterium SAOS 7]
MSKIDPSLYLPDKSKERKTGNSSLGKDEFLKILMVQLQNQDPLSPMEDKDFIAQMATFSSLEQQVNMTAAINQMAQVQYSSQMISYNSFVGKEVVWHKIEESTEEVDEGGKKPEPIITEGTGKIVSVQFKDGGVEFTLEDGTKLEPGNISEIKGGTASGGHSLVEASQLIGRKVTWQKEEVEQTATVQSVSIKDGTIWLHLDNGEKIATSELTKIE